MCHWNRYQPLVVDPPAISYEEDYTKHVGCNKICVPRESFATDVSSRTVKFFWTKTANY